MDVFFEDNIPDFIQNNNDQNNIRTNSHTQSSRNTTIHDYQQTPINRLRNRVTTHTPHTQHTPHTTYTTYTTHTTQINEQITNVDEILKSISNLPVEIRHNINMFYHPKMSDSLKNDLHEHFEKITKRLADLMRQRDAPINVRVYATNYNVMRIMSDMGGLNYAS